MDLCLNITTEPLFKKPEKSESSTKEKPKRQVTTNRTDSFDITWSKNKNTKAGFVRRRSQKKGLIQFETKQKTPSITVRENGKSETLKEKSNNKLQESNEIVTEDHVKTNKNKVNQIKKIKAKEKVKKKVNNNVITIDDDDDEVNYDKNFTKHDGKTSGFKKTYHLFDHNLKIPKSDAENKNIAPATENMFSEGKTFSDLNIHSHTVTNLERDGIKTLTVVQEKAIPEIMAGGNVFVRSQTGSGKTLSYAIPIIERLQRITPHLKRQDGVQAIVVVPTRELALQTYDLFIKLVEPFRWLVPGRLCGGEKRSAEKARLRKGITVLIGTPGRLLDHVLHTRVLRLDRVSTIVLDEADRLLDMGFQGDINTLIQQIDAAQNGGYDPIAMLKSQEPKISNTSRQTILLSATLTSNVQDLAKFTMTNFVYVDPLQNNNDMPDVSQSTLPVNSEIVIPQTVKQKYVVTDVKARLAVLSAYIVEKVNKGKCKMLIFMASKQMVEYHEMLFKKCLVRKKIEKKSNVVVLDEEESSDEEDVEVLDVKFFALHGSMDQKQRVSVFKEFRKAENGVLLCTDVAARGLDIPNADYVVQYNGPLRDEDYIHRVGRTGRAGQIGQALLFMTEPELSYINHLQEKKFTLSRIRQDHILQSLVEFMSHLGPKSAETAAELLQRRYEKSVAENDDLLKAACLAFSSWSRYYSSYPASQKKFFNFHTAHLGHYVTSFALRKTPQEVSKFVRTKQHLLTEEKKLNKKLEIHKPEEDSTRVVTPKPKKRKRVQELMISEFDSGLTPIKKKKSV